MLDAMLIGKILMSGLIGLLVFFFFQDCKKTCGN